MLLALISLTPHSVTAQRADPAAVHVQDLTRSIPLRPGDSKTGSEFASAVLKMDRDQREQAIQDELFRGNVPDFLRKLVPVRLSYEVPGEKPLVATIFVAPDYLAIGSNDDFLRIPMDLLLQKPSQNILASCCPLKKSWMRSMLRPLII